MTDIVDTLREYSQEWYEMCADVHIPLNNAADEIERPLNELAIWKAKAPSKELDRFDAALEFHDRTDLKEHPYPRERLWSDCEDELKAAREEVELLRITKKIDEDEIERLRHERSVTETRFAMYGELLSEHATEIERLRGLLANAPCTCENPPPGDWPHDPTNQECYLNRIREVLDNE